jgi:hypothetical protein
VGVSAKRIAPTYLIRARMRVSTTPARIGLYWSAQQSASRHSWAPWHLEGYLRGSGFAVTVAPASSQCLPDMPGPPDSDSVEEWLCLTANARRNRVSAGHSEYVILIGSAL